MTLSTWKNVLLMWVKGALYMKNNPKNLEDTDLEGFARFCFTYANASSSTPSGPFLNILTESYPQFTPNLDEDGRVDPDDYVYVYTFLLHYTCVLKPSDYFIQNLNNLSIEFRSNINQFIYLTTSGIHESRSRLVNLIVNMIHTENDFPTAPIADGVPASDPDPDPVENTSDSSENDEEEFCMRFDAMIFVSPTDGQSLEQSGSKTQLYESVANNDACNLSNTEKGSQVNSDDCSTDEEVDYSGQMKANNSSSDDDDMDILTNLETSRSTSDLDTEDESLFSKDEFLSVNEESLSAKEEALFAKEESLSAKEESLSAKEESLSAKEESISAKEESLSAKEESLSAKEESLSAKEESLSAKEESLSAKEESISAKEESLSAKEESLCAKEESLCAKEESISAKEESLSAKEVGLFTKEESLCVMEGFLYAEDECLCSKSKFLFIKEVSLSAKEQSLVIKEQFLLIKEVSLYTKEESLTAKEDYLYARERSLSIQEENFITRNESLTAMEESFSLWRDSLTPTAESMELYHVDENRRMRQQIRAIETGNFIGFVKGLLKLMERYEMVNPRLDNFDTSLPFVLELIDEHLAKFFGKFKRETRLVDQMREECDALKAELDLVELGQPLAQSSIILLPENSEQEDDQKNDKVITSNSQKKLAENYVMEELSVIKMQVARIMEKRNIQNRKLQDLADHLIFQYDEICIMAVMNPIMVQDYFQSVMTEFVSGCMEQKETMEYLLQQLMEKRNMDRKTSPIDVDSTKKIIDLQERLEMSQEDLITSEKQLEISHQQLITAQQELNQVKQQLLKKSDECKRLELKTLNQQLDSYQTTNESSNKVADLQQQLKDFEEKLKQSELELLQKTDECEKLKLLKTPEHLEKSQVKLESSEIMLNSETQEKPSTSQQHLSPVKHLTADDASKLIMDLKKRYDEIILKAQERLKPNVEILETTNEFIKELADGKPKLNDFKEAQELLEHIKVMGKALELIKNQEQMNESNIQMTGVESKKQQSTIEADSLNSDLVRLSTCVMEQLISQKLTSNSMAMIQSQLLPVNMLANQIYAQEQFIKNYLINILQLKINILENRQNSILYLFLNNKQMKLQSQDDGQSQQHEPKLEEPKNQKPVQKNVEIQTVLSMTPNPANRTH